MLYRFRGLEGRSSRFRKALVRTGKLLGVDPNFIAAVMQTESGFNPHISNQWCVAQGRSRNDCAYGLIQFMPFVLRTYGTNADALAGMSDVDQLQYVERFYRPYASKIKCAGDAYMATFLPAFVGCHRDRVLGVEEGVSVSVDKDNRLLVELVSATVAGFSHELTGVDELGYGLLLGAIYEQNSGFDRNQDGAITVGEVTATAERNYSEAIERGIFVDTKVTLLPLEVSEEQHNANRDKWLMEDDNE